MNHTRTSFRRLLSVHAADIGFCLALLALLAFASVASEVFLTDRNILNVSRQLVTNGLVSIAMLLVILSGGIDLSVGPVVAFAGLLVAGLQNTLPEPWRSRRRWASACWSDWPTAS